MTLEDILQNSSKYFYTDLILALAALVASIIGYVNRRNFKEFKFFYVYPLLSFLQLCFYLFGRFIIKYPLVEELRANNVSVNLFVLFEYLSIYLFYYATIQKKIARRITHSLLIVYLLATTLFWASDGLTSISIPLYLIQALFILTISLLGLIDFFSARPNQSLLNEPIFWISAGIFTYFLCSMPFYFAESFIFDEDGFIREQALYSLNFILYTIFFILIIRAFLCKPLEKQ